MKTIFNYVPFTFVDPYVKVSLMCEGRRLKKRKTSTKRNTLNPVYNEAIVFDVPPENIEQISLLIAVMDYDRLVFAKLYISHTVLFDLIFYSYNFSFQFVNFF